MNTLLAVATLVAIWLWILSLVGARLRRVSKFYPIVKTDQKDEA